MAALRLRRADEPAGWPVVIVPKLLDLDALASNSSSARMLRRRLALVVFPTVSVGFPRNVGDYLSA
jgi:hypothetical protein